MQVITVSAGLEQVGEPAESVDAFAAGNSVAMRTLEQLLGSLCFATHPVLLLGEGGVGKRMYARRLHHLSLHREEPLTCLTCSAAPAATFALNGANGGADGLPATGTLLLEEVSELSLPAQHKLLERVGHGDGSGSHLRLIATSRKPLDQEVRAGRFREDLFYRLATVTLRVPPLRQRREDIPELVNFFLNRCAAQFHRPIPVLSAHAYAAFAEYSWPENVRELESTISALVATGAEHVALAALRWNTTRRPGRQEIIPLKQAAKDASRSAERELILKVLTRTHWNRKRAALELKISYKALLYKLKQIGVDEPGRVHGGEQS